MAPYRVLVVDDEEATRAGLTELISGWGYQSRPACDARDALTVCREFAPHVVLSDLMMPGPSGIELMGAVREDLPHGLGRGANLIGVLYFPIKRIRHACSLSASPLTSSP
jgi:CheY-like chemotaxis protein